jgi:protein-tyrosine phosphatase
MNFKIKSFLFLITLHCYPSHSNVLNQLDALYEAGKYVLLDSPCNLITKASAFNFNRIAGDECSSKALLFDGMAIEFEGEKIIRFNDGKKTPLFLGSIPRQASDITQLINNGININNKNKVEIFSLNLKFERDNFGLTSLILNDPALALFKYPTIDLMSPSIVDMLRLVRDLENRDSREKSLTFIHCRAGAGRSPLAVAVYLLKLIHRFKIKIHPDRIVEYLMLRRSHVSLNARQKACLYVFFKALQNAGSFETLYSRLKNAVLRRDAEVAHL